MFMSLVRVNISEDAVDKFQFCIDAGKEAFECSDIDSECGKVT